MNQNRITELRQNPESANHADILDLLDVIEDKERERGFSQALLKSLTTLRAKHLPLKDQAETAPAALWALQQDLPELLAIMDFGLSASPTKCREAR